MFTRLTSLIAPRGVSIAPTFSSKLFQPRFFSTVPPQITQTNLVEKKKKKQKDPNAPKRPLSSYFLFQKSIRPQVVSSQPNFSVTEVAKEIAARWRALSDEQKKTFIDQSAKGKTRYAAERETYLKNIPKPIKRPANPYIVFSNEVRPDILKKNPSFLVTQVVRETARLWRSLTDSQKAKYNNVFQAQLEKHRQLFPPKPKVVAPKKIKAAEPPKANKANKANKAPKDSKKAKDTKTKPAKATKKVTLPPLKTK